MGFNNDIAGDYSAPILQLPIEEQITMLFHFLSTGRNVQHLTSEIYQNKYSCPMVGRLMLQWREYFQDMMNSMPFIMTYSKNSTYAFIYNSLRHVKAEAERLL